MSDYPIPAALIDEVKAATAEAKAITDEILKYGDAQKASDVRRKRAIEALREYMDTQLGISRFDWT